MWTGEGVPSFVPTGEGVPSFVPTGGNPVPNGLGILFPRPGNRVPGGWESGSRPPGCDLPCRIRISRMVSLCAARSRAGRDTAGTYCRMGMKSAVRPRKYTAKAGDMFAFETSSFIRMEEGFLFSV